MSHMKKIENFRKEIRREQLNNIFAEKRIKMMGEYRNSQQESMMIEQQADILNQQHPETLTVDALKRIASLAQNSTGIALIHKAEYEQHLLKFLAEKYNNTDQQYYSSHIICNLYFSPKEEPSQQLTRQMLRMLTDTDMKIMENVFFFISNTMIEFPQWFDLIMSESYRLGDKLPFLFKFQTPSIGYLQAVVSFIFRVIHRKGKHSSFLKLKQAFIRLITQQPRPDVKNLMKKSVMCLYLLVINFPQQMAPIIVKGKVLQKLIKLWDFFFERKTVKMTLEIINATLHEVVVQDFENLIMPFLVMLIERNFEVGDKNSSTSPYQLKMETYLLLKTAIQSRKLNPEFFASLRIFQVLFDQMRLSDDPEALCSLAYIFVPISLNSNNQQFNNEIRNSVQRAVKLNNSFELAAFLQQFDRSTI